MCLNAQPDRRDSLLHTAQQSYNEGKYDLATRILSTGIQQDTPYSTATQAALLLLLSDAYAQLNEKEKAYHYFDLYRRIKDSLSLRERAQIHQELGKKYATASKDKAIVEQQLHLKKNEEQRIKKGLLIQGSIYIAVILLLLSLVSLSNYRKKRRINQKIREQAAYKYEIERLHATLKGEREERERISRQLQTTIYPEIHVAQAMLEDIKSAIPQLHGSLAFSDARQIIRDIEKGLDAMLLHTQQQQEDTTYSLQRLIRNFLGNIPKSYPLQVEFDSSGTAIMLSRDIMVNLLRILQELVQNIIKHSGATKASVTLSYAAGHVTLLVSDNGKGSMPAPDHFGIGLLNVSARLTRLNGSMTITRSNGTTINIILPLTEAGSKA